MFTCVVFIIFGNCVPIKQPLETCTLRLDSDNLFN